MTDWRTPEGAEGLPATGFPTATQRPGGAERRSFMRLISWGVVAVAAGLLAACSSAPAPQYPGDSWNVGAPGEVTQVTEGVEYYPACSNETLEFGGKVYYPFTPSNAEDFPYEAGFIAPDPDAEATAQALGDLGLGGGFGGGLARAAGVGEIAPMMVAPGPGDDVGTLTEFDGGFAYWISESGYISTWLTTTPFTYSWVC